MVLIVAKVSQEVELTLYIWTRIGDMMVDNVERPFQVKVGLSVLLVQSILNSWMMYSDPYWTK